MSQQSVKAQLDLPFPGVLADVTFWKDVTSYVNNDAVEIPFGVMVVEAAGDKLAVLPSSAADTPLGVTVHSHAYERELELGDTGLLPEITMGVLARGRIFVRPETLAAATTDPVHMRITGQSAAVAASLDLATVTTNVNTVVAAAVAGAAGNNISVELTPDGTGVGNLEEIGNSVVFHFESAVTTVANFETAVAGSTLLVVQTPGTGTNVFSGADQISATFLTGGANIAELGIPGSFLNAPIATETVLVTGARWVRAFQGNAAVLEFDRLDVTFTADI